MFDDPDYVRYTDHYLSPSDHFGIDIVSKKRSNPIHGAPILSISNGNVHTADQSDSAGHYVIIESDIVDPATNKRLYVRYLHMNSTPSCSICHLTV